MVANLMAGDKTVTGKQGVYRTIIPLPQDLSPMSIGVKSLERVGNPQQKASGGEPAPGKSRQFVSRAGHDLLEKIGYQKARPLNP